MLLLFLIYFPRLYMLQENTLVYYAFFPGLLVIYSNTEFVM